MADTRVAEPCVSLAADGGRILMELEGSSIIERRSGELVPAVRMNPNGARALAAELLVLADRLDGGR